MKEQNSLNKIKGHVKTWLFMVDTLYRKKSALGNKHQNGSLKQQKLHQPKEISAATVANTQHTKFT